MMCLPARMAAGSNPGKRELMVATITAFTWGSATACLKSATARAGFAQVLRVLQRATNSCHRPQRVWNRRANRPAVFSQSIRNQQSHISFIAPGFAAIFRHDAAQRVDVALQIRFEFVEFFPRIHWALMSLPVIPSLCALAR